MGETVHPLDHGLGEAGELGMRMLDAVLEQQEIGAGEMVIGEEARRIERNLRNQKGLNSEISPRKSGSVRMGNSPSFVDSSVCRSTRALG